MDCADHGRSAAAFVCHHVASGEGQGFFASTQDPDDPCPDAWCGECERRLVANGGAWDEQAEAFAQITVICTGCSAVARARNQSP